MIFSEGPHKVHKKNLEGFFADLLKTGGVATEGGFTVQIIPSYLLDVIYVTIHHPEIFVKISFFSTETTEPKAIIFLLVVVQIFGVILRFQLLPFRSTTVERLLYPQ